MGVAVLLAAALFRLVALDATPPGLHHDEVIIAQVAKDILRGRLAIYFPEGYGQEPLYHYLLAGMFAVGGANEFTLRLTTALLGILTVAVAYRMTRAMFGQNIALLSIAWMATSLWPVFFSRVGLRNITLPLMITWATWLLWSSLKFRSGPSSNLRSACAGIAFGLTFYTYQGSRVFPFVFLIFGVYLAVFHRSVFARNWKGIVLFFVIASLVATPLVYYLTVANPLIEERVRDLAGPLQTLRAGDPTQVLQLAQATAGMFTVHGDGVWLYNVGGRPIFPEPISGVLFYVGLLVTLWRWRKPAYALVLVWLPVSLIPATVTWPAPDFVRVLGVLPVVFIFPAIAIETIAEALNHLIHPDMYQMQRKIHWCSLYPLKLKESVSLIAPAFAIGLLIWNVALTTRDYFTVWPRNPRVRSLYQTTWTQATRWLDASADSTPVAASGPKIHDLDPQSFDILLRRRDVRVKWFDCRTSILLPVTGSMRYISPDFFPCDADLWARFLGEAQVITQPRWTDSGEVIFTAHRLEHSNLAGLQNLPHLQNFGLLSLVGAEITRLTVIRGSEAELLTFWAVNTRVPTRVAIFVHLVDVSGKPLAQWDGFDFGEGQLEPGDQLVERHRFLIPTDIAPGTYCVIVGVYYPVTMKRLILPNGEDQVPLGIIDVR